jgi:hypothetical protein
MQFNADEISFRQELAQLAKVGTVGVPENEPIVVFKQLRSTEDSIDVVY